LEFPTIFEMIVHVFIFCSTYLHEVVLPALAIISQNTFSTLKNIKDAFTSYPSYPTSLIFTLQANKHSSLISIQIGFTL